MRRNAACNRFFSAAQRESSACDLPSTAFRSAWIVAVVLACSRSAASNASCALSISRCRRSLSSLQGDDGDEPQLGMPI